MPLVTPEEWLPYLAQKLDDERPVVASLRRYVNGNAPLPEMGKNTRASWEAFQKKARVNFGGVACVSHANRIVLSGVRVGDDHESDASLAARRIYRDNGPRVNAAGAGASWTEVPGLLVKLTRDIASLGDAWGGSLKGAFGATTSGVKDWIAKQLGFPVGGYATGTSWASPGLAWVGERGPELVSFRGGERVYSAEQSAAATRPLSVTVNAPREAFRDFDAFMKFVADMEHRAALA